MHPALSVILFTSASGGGYFMLALLGLFGWGGAISPDSLSGLLAFIWSLGMIAAGLLSSTLHLGHPERAWRAFSQWRTSWLSREGVASVLTYAPALLLGFGWIVLGRRDGTYAWAG